MVLPPPSTWKTVCAPRSWMVTLATNKAVARANGHLGRIGLSLRDELLSRVLMRELVEPQLQALRRPRSSPRQLDPTHEVWEEWERRDVLHVRATRSYRAILTAAQLGAHILDLEAHFLARTVEDERTHDDVLAPQWLPLIQVDHVRQLQADVEPRRAGTGEGARDDEPRRKMPCARLVVHRVCGARREPDAHRRELERYAGG